jgi:hypothetical protein
MTSCWTPIISLVVGLAFVLAMYILRRRRQRAYWLHRGFLPELLYGMRDLVHQRAGSAPLVGAVAERTGLANAAAQVLPYLRTHAVLLDRWDLDHDSPLTLGDLEHRFEKELSTCGLPDEKGLWRKFAAERRPHLLILLIIKLTDPARHARFEKGSA